MGRVSSLLRGFGYAFHGIGYTIRTQRNMRIHLNAVVLVALIGVLAEFPSWKWVALALCCGLVTALELVNTAVEVLCDRVTQARDSAIGHAKDAAAGAVLAAALFSVAVEGILLVSGGSWSALCGNLRSSPWKAALLVLALLLSALHVLFWSAPGGKTGSRKEKS